MTKDFPTNEVEQIDALLHLNANGSLTSPVPGLAIELLKKYRAHLSDVAQGTLDRDLVAKTIYATWFDADFITENHFRWFDAGKDNPDSCVHYSNVAKAYKVADAVLALAAQPPAAPVEHTWDQGEHEGCGIDSQRAYARWSAGNVDVIKAAIREHFKGIGNSAVTSSDGIERVYYSGFSLVKLAESVAAALTAAQPQSVGETVDEFDLADVIGEETYADDDGVCGTIAAAEAIIKKFDVRKRVGSPTVTRPTL